MNEAICNDTNCVEVGDFEILDLLRESRKRAARNNIQVETDTKDDDDSIEDEDNISKNFVEDEDGEEEEEEEEEEDDDDDDEDDEDNEDNYELEEGEDEEEEDNKNANVSKLPEFEIEAELARKYAEETEGKRKYELLHKKRKSELTNKRDSALIELRNARKRKHRDFSSESNSDTELELESNSISERDSDASDYLKSKKNRNIRKQQRNDNLFSNEKTQERLLKKCERILQSISLRMMEAVHLKRDRIEFMLEHPKFDDYLRGSYVKVPIINNASNVTTYLICEISDVYINNDGGCILILRRGGMDKEWDLSSISNEPFSEEDLLEWKAMVREFNISDIQSIINLPKNLELKATMLRNFQYGDDDIAFILQEKHRNSSLNMISGKVLIEKRTNIQTQIRQLEQQLKNSYLSTNDRIIKVKKIEELNEELDVTISNIEKLQLRKELTHPDKSLKVTSAHYIGGQQGKGSGITDASGMAKPKNIIINNNSMNTSASKLLAPGTSSTLIRDSGRSNSIGIISQSKTFGRRECRPSVMWETKRINKNLRLDDQSVNQSSNSIQEVLITIDDPPRETETTDIPGICKVESYQEVFVKILGEISKINRSLTPISQKTLLPKLDNWVPSNLNIESKDGKILYTLENFINILNG
ncbi:hypothetical protein cand_034600 [Cryptosporidium andersoni]|uniref:Plus3 domain-containing protein n=1 Tax=Cryptosporidium andersoni TaxID=117008 RepID=A0A1J4MXI4_9CRYT|nr:hypothetical protein cand_034600 [Cryptosporidium andersoni]